MQYLNYASLYGYRVFHCWTDRYRYWILHWYNRVYKVLLHERNRWPTRSIPCGVDESNSLFCVKCLHKMF